MILILFCQCEEIVLQRKVNSPIYYFILNYVSVKFKVLFFFLSENNISSIFF